MDHLASLNRQLLADAVPAVTRGEPVRGRYEIYNTDRAVGSAVAGEIARRFGERGLDTGALHFRFSGSAGQSFGAFATRGLTLELEGEANDYLGKGLCGGRIIVAPPKSARLLADGTVIVGNTVLYGATSGEAFIAGAAGERFGVRNSGATAVVEGVGDHGCEYMTGGVVVVLGAIGRNFAAGMSGGVAYVVSDDARPLRLHEPMRFELTRLMESGDALFLRSLLEQHVRLTGSRRGRLALTRWVETLRAFVRVMPLEYKAALARGTTSALTSEEAARYG